MKHYQFLKINKYKNSNLSNLQMATKPWSILLVLFTTLLTSSAQILYKLGSNTLTFSFAGILKNYYFIFGLILYTIGGILIIISFRGGEVSVLYPIIAMSYIWVSFMSQVYLEETMNIFKWIGVLAIILGITSISFGSKNSASGAYAK